MSLFLICCWLCADRGQVGIHIEPINVLLGMHICPLLWQVLRGAHHMCWLSSYYPSPAPPDLGQVGSGLLWISCQPSLQEMPQENEMLDRVLIFGSLSNNTQLRKPLLFPVINCPPCHLSAGSCLFHFKLISWLCLIPPPPCSLPCLICFSPAGSDLFLLGTATCLLFKCHIELTVVYQPRE